MTNSLDILIGTWATEATHPALPDVVVHGRTTFERAARDRFLVQRAETDHADFPDSVAILGAFDDEPLSMYYFDSRGVHRVYRMEMTDDGWRIWRDFPEFSQRLEAAISEDGGTVSGVWQVSRDGSTWADDVAITFRRV